MSIRRSQVPPEVLASIDRHGSGNLAEPPKPNRKSGTNHGVPKEKETDLVYVILKYLKSRHILAWRQNTGGVTREHKGKVRHIRFGVRGAHDISGILPNGRRLEIECKVRGQKLTKAQGDFQYAINSNGGMAFTAEGLDDVIRNLG